MEIAGKEMNMKKTICLLLCILLLSAVFSGCGPQASTGESTADSTAAALSHELKVGYGRADITPELGNAVQLAGFTYMRPFDEILDPIFATCIALTDETDNTVLLFHLDLGNAWTNFSLQARLKVSRQTGIPAGQIMVCTTHNHSAPCAISSTIVANGSEYQPFVYEKMIEAALAAMEDRKPAKMYTTTTYTENMNFVRHYKLSDGSFGGDHFGDFNKNTIVGHAVEVDNAMQLVKFTREGAKDIILMNYQGHPTGHSGDQKNSILSHVHQIRKVVEAELDCRFAYFLGGSGNVNSTSRITEEMMAVNDLNYYRVHGQKLGQIAVEAASGFTESKTCKVQVLSNTFAGTSKEDESKTIDIPMYAFSIGDVAFITAPYEMFCENGKAIKDGSPFSMTFIASCSNGSLSYMPSAPTFAYGGYEVESTQFVSGTAEKLVDTYISMLNELHQPN